MKTFFLKSVLFFAKPMFYTILCMSLGFVFWQCADKDTVSGVPDEISISVDKRLVNLPSEANSFELTITSSGTDWDVSEEVTWLEATKVDDTTLKVSYEQNTGEDRTGKVIASIESESVEITVNQSAGPYVVLGTTEYMLSPSATMNHEITLDVSFFRSSSQWHASETALEATRWLHVASPSSRSRSGIDNKVLTIDIEENIDASDRTTSLLLQAEDASRQTVFSSTLTMTQAQAIIVVDRTISIPAVAGMRTVTVTTTNGEDWSIKGYQDITDADNPKDTPGWLTPSKDNGLKLTYEDNSATPRIARIVLGVGEDHEIAIQVTQEKVPVVITVQRYINKTASAMLEDGILLRTSISGGKDTLLVNTSGGTAWTVTVSTWASEEKIDGGTDVDTLIVTYESNTDGGRGGAVVITSETTVFRLNVDQYGLEIFPYIDGTPSFAPILSNSTTLPEVAASAGKDTILIFSGYEGVEEYEAWSADESLNWVALRAIPSVRYEDTLEVIYERNAGSQRSGEISISSGVVTKTIQVSQSSAAR